MLRHSPQQIHVNPSYEAVWRLLASAVFRDQAGLLLGYGYPGRVDETNADAAVKKHPTPEHIAQILLARRLRAGGAAGDTGRGLEDVVRWYGAMVVNVYGSTARHYKLRRQRVSEMISLVSHMIAQVATEPEDEAEAELLYDVDAAELGRQLTARVRAVEGGDGGGGMEVLVRDVTSLGTRVVRGKKVKGEYPQLVEDLLLFPPSLDSPDPRSSRVEVVVPEGEAEGASAAEAGTHGELLLLRAQDDEDATYAALWTPPSDRRAWWEAPLAMPLIQAAVQEAMDMTGGSLSKALSVVAVALPLPKDIARAAWTLREGAQAEASEVASEMPEVAEVASEMPEVASEMPEMPEVAEGAQAEASEVASEMPEMPEAASEMPEMPEVAHAEVRALPRPQARAQPPAPSRMAWVTVRSLAGALSCLRKVRRLALREAGRDPVAWDLLELSPELLLSVLVAPDSTLRQDTWALLAELTQDAVDGPASTRARLALGLIREDTVSDADILADEGRSGVVAMGGPMLRLLLPAGSPAAALLEQAMDVLAEFEERHRIGAAQDGRPGSFVCVSRRRAGPPSRAATPQEAARAQRLAGLRLGPREVLCVRGSGTGMPAASASPAGFRVGFALKGIQAWREALRSQGRRFAKALEKLLNEAYDASPEVSALLLGPGQAPAALARTTFDSSHEGSPAAT
jgi:hypothetical protein